MILKSIDLKNLRKKYLQIKKEYPGYFVFIQEQDSYITFEEDMKIISTYDEFNFQLEGEYGGSFMGSIPGYAKKSFFDALIEKGYKIVVSSDDEPFSTQAECQAECDRLNGEVK